jgi:putative mRNA 3-end processing factor
MQQTLINAGFDLKPVVRITPETPKELLKDTVVIAPPGAEGTSWMKKFHPYSIGVCSGWMQVRGNARRRNVDAGFALSDHCDWQALLDSVKATGAEKVFVTHGFQSAFSRYLNEENIAVAAEVKTEFGDEDEEANSPLEVKNEEAAPTNLPEGEELNYY